MCFRLFALISLIAVSPLTAADFTTVAEAYEVTLSDLRLPESTTGVVSFRKCKECDSQSISVDTDTQYFLNGASIELELLRKMLRASDNLESGNAGILHHFGSDLALQISVWHQNNP